jgi:hypothetical protein
VLARSGDSGALRRARAALCVTTEISAHPVAGRAVWHSRGAQAEKPSDGLKQADARPRDCDDMCQACGIKTYVEETRRQVRKMQIYGLFPNGCGRPYVPVQALVRHGLSAK